MGITGAKAQFEAAVLKLILPVPLTFTTGKHKY
jgi:hypothetical protein